MRASSRMNCRGCGMVFAFAALLGAYQSAEAQLAQPYPSYRLQRQADDIQRCLEKELAPLRLESTMTRDGRLEESVRVTAWSGLDAACVSPKGFNSRECTRHHDIRRVVSLVLTIDGYHPSWSPNERARLEDGIIDRLIELRGGVVIDTARQVYPRALSLGDQLALRIRISYRGSALMQRDLDEWLQTPKAVQINMDLLQKPSVASPLAQRVVTARVHPRAKTGGSHGYSDKWREETLSAVANAANAMLMPVSCTTPTLSVSHSGGRLQLDTSGYVGINENTALLLVPSVETSIANLWPIAKVRSAGTMGGTAELETLRGDPTACATGCRAIPL